MSKRKGRQRDSAFTLLHDDEFVQSFYNRRHTLSPIMRERVEREAKARGLRNVRKRKS